MTNQWIHKTNEKKAYGDETRDLVADALRGDGSNIIDDTLVGGEVVGEPKAGTNINTST